MNPKFTKKEIDDVVAYLDRDFYRLPDKPGLLRVTSAWFDLCQYRRLRTAQNASIASCHSDMPPGPLISIRAIRTRRPRTLRQALAWLLLGALGPLLLGSTLFLWSQWDLQRDASMNRLRDLSLALQLSVDRELALDQTALQVLATSAAIDMRDWPAFYAAATEAAKLRPGRWVLLGDRSGKTIINTYAPFGTLLPEFSEAHSQPGKRVEWNGRSLPWFDTGVLSEPLRSGLPRVSDLFYGPMRKGPVVALSVPVKRGGEAAYSLAFAYPPEAFIDFLQQQPESANVVMLVIDGNGNIIARNRQADEAVGRISQPPFSQGRALAREAVVETVTFDGIPAFFAYRRSGLTNWTIAVGVPSEKILEPARRSLALWIALLSAMLAVAALLAHRFWRRVALPLTELARAARNSGERDIDIAPTDIQEVETLCRALREASAAEHARRDEVARRLALEQREHLVASQHAQELQAADRRKDEFLAMLGHELRNPLAPIMNALAVLHRRGSVDADMQRLHDMMERQARQLARLVDDLLDVARINTGKIVLRTRRLDLRTIAGEAAQAAQPGMDRRGHAFSLLLPNEPLWVDGDEARLLQIIGNLLGNAAKYTDPGGKVTLCLSRDAQSAVAAVTDTGRGIAPGLLPHVYDLYTQGDLSGVRAAGGLGIGLHIVKHLVEKHGGAVSVESAGTGRGSRFEVRFPLAPPPEPAMPECAASAPQRALDLLVVDDNRDAAESLALMLRLDGHAVRIVCDGEAAIKSAIDQPPDAVLLDINMPGLSGCEVARRMKAEPSLRDTVLVAVTGYGQATHRREIEAAGIQHHLTKPASEQEIRDVLAAFAGAGRARPMV